MKKIITLAVLFISLNAQSQNVSFGKVVSPNSFKSYWKLDDKEMDRYQNYMQVAGKYRHQQSNPLVVLSIIAKDPEDKGYYAAKAAKYEHNMVQQEIQSAWLISGEMQKQGLAEKMEIFTNDLTGINTSDYVPGDLSKNWKKGDRFVLVIDDICRQMLCVKSFEKTIVAIPSHVEKVILFKKLKAEYDKKSIKRLAVLYPQILFKRYDMIEHGSLSSLKNQAAQVRDNKIVRKL